MSDRTKKFFQMVLAVIIAIAGWAYVVYNFYPNTDVTYRNVPITFQGEEELANKGFGIVETDIDSISVTLNQKRVSTGRISAENINVVADVSDSIEGNNGVVLKISSPDGTVVKDSSTRLITVSVEKIKTVDVDVEVQFSDATDLGAEPLVENLSAESVTVAGAASEMNSVDKVVAYLSVSEMSEHARNFTRDLVAVDKDGNVLPHMIIYPGSVSFEGASGFTKSVKLNVLVEGDDENGYTRTYDVPSSVLVKGRADALENITSIDTKKIDLSNITENTDIELEYDLPDGIYIANVSKGQLARITVTEKKEEDEKTED